MRLGSRNLCHENFRQKHLFCCIFWVVYCFEIIGQRNTCCSFHPFYREYRLNWQLLLSQIYHAALHCNCQRKGRLVNDLIYEADNAASFIFNYLNYLAQLLTVGAILTLLITVNGKWLTISLLIFVSLWLLIGRPYFHLARTLGKRGIRLNQDLNSALFESLNAIKDIKISQSEPFQINKIDLLCSENNSNRKSKKIAHAVPALGRELILAIAVLVLALILPSDLGQVKSVMPQVALFIAAAARLTANASTIIALRFKITSQFPSFKLIVKRLNVESLLEEDLEKGKVADHLEGRISIENCILVTTQRSLFLRA